MSARFTLLPTEQVPQHVPFPRTAWMLLSKTCKQTDRQILYFLKNEITAYLHNYDENTLEHIYRIVTSNK